MAQVRSRYKRYTPPDTRLKDKKKKPSSLKLKSIKKLSRSSVHEADVVGRRDSKLIKARYYLNKAGNYGRRKLNKGK